MKISELIKKLQEIQKEHGDIEVIHFLYGQEKKLNYHYIEYNKYNNKLYIGG